MARSVSSGTAASSRRCVLLAGAAAAALLAQPAQAQAPQGGSVAQGAATISATAAETRIRQATPRAVIDWQSFDVGRDHRVAFDQPGAHAATLNRVHSGRESTIAGQITAPGTVIIQNTHGVVFTGTARVDVGGLVATSRAADANRFMAEGRLELRGAEAAGARVENQGSITVREAGLAALVGGRVANSGTIVARRGTVALASGETTTIDLAGDGVVRIAVEGDARRPDAAVANTGLIDAGGGRVLLTAGTASGLLAHVINTSGVIRAASAEGAGGTIELVGRGQGTVRVAGTLDASGATRGGSVTVTGQNVRVASGAQVVANGRSAGGTVRVGGDRQGQGALRRAETTTLEAGARIEARATEGAGGSVILWADQATWVAGAIAADGLLAGGFIETSAKGDLGVAPSASVTPGAGGTWLLDPRNVRIQTTGAGVSPGVNNPPAGPGDWVVDRDVIQSVLDLGSDVTITTNVAGPQLGNITVNAGITWSGAGSLTLIADNNLVINQAITTSGAGSFTGIAATDTTIAAPLTSSGSGDLRIDTGRNLIVNHNVIASGTGGIGLQARTGNLIASNAGNDRNIAITTTAGALRLEATAGTVRLQRLASADTRNVRVQTDSGPLDIVAGTAIEVRGNAGASWARVRSETGAITLRAPSIDVIGGTGSNAFAEVVAGAGGSLTMEASRRIRVLDGTSPGRVFALNGADLTMRAPQQFWNGVVRAGDAAVGNGGSVRVAGAISATVAPLFNLGPGSDFTLEASAPGPGSGTTASSYTSPVGLRVDTRGTGTITLNAPVTAAQVALVSEERVTLAPGATVTATGTGDALTIAAGRGFDNQAGAGALVAPNGRWLVFLDTFGGMLGTEPATPEFDLYDRPFDYTDPARSDVAGQVVALDVLGGNRIVYGEQPVLVVTGQTLAKVYGTTVAPGASIDASALRPKDGPLATVLTGGTTSTSAGAPDSAAVGAYATSPVAALTARGAAQRYALVLVDGTLTVTPAPLTVTANDATRTYGAANPAFSATYAGFVLGEGPGVLGGTLTFATPATPGSPVGGYAITPSGLTSGNYAITFVPGTLTVTPAPLTVTANDATRPEGQPNPPFSATYAGFVLGEGPGVLGGTLTFATPATPASPPGAYPIAPSGLTSGNYAIIFVNGLLTITPVEQPPVVPPAVTPQTALLAGAEPFRRGVQPYTPGDAGFRTTVLEAGPAVADPFRLTYTLGDVVQLAVGEPTLPGGFVPAGAARPPEGDPAGGRCGGPINLGLSAEACRTISLPENYWTTRADAAGP
ncbi:MBG domain-containing protein [Elioraea sp.]|uniref:MBG domain-containing protein n=1 Tax=Elioraea sp. TaxID=2185103 RepID=UPI00307DF519